MSVKKVSQSVTVMLYVQILLGVTYVHADLRIEFCPILKGFVSYQGTYPATLWKFTTAKHQGKGTADHMMPLGDWVCLTLSLSRPVLSLSICQCIYLSLSMSFTLRLSLHVFLCVRLSLWQLVQHSLQKNLMEKGLANSNWLVTTRIAPSFP